MKCGFSLERNRCPLQKLETLENFNTYIQVVFFHENIQLLFVCLHTAVCCVFLNGLLSASW